MFKLMFVLHEKAAMPREEALRYWREEHAPLVAKVPGVRRYVQSHAVAAPATPIPFLGIAELVFDDEAAFAAAAGSAEFAAAVADVPNFADPQLPTAFVEDVVVV